MKFSATKPSIVLTIFFNYHLSFTCVIKKKLFQRYNVRFVISYFLKPELRAEHKTSALMEIALINNRMVSFRYGIASLGIKPNKLKIKLSTN